MSISRRIEHLEKVVPKEEPLQGSEEEAIAHVNETLKRIALQLDFDLWVEKELLKSKELILEDKLSKHELALLKPDEQFLKYFAILLEETYKDIEKLKAQGKHDLLQTWAESFSKEMNQFSLTD